MGQAIMGQVAASNLVYVSILKSAMTRCAVAVVACVILSSTSLMLHGCASCDEEESEKCFTTNAGATCATYQKQIDCYSDCRDHEFKSGGEAMKGEDLIAIWSHWGKS